MASRSLEVFSAGIAVAGNNISNASTPGYIREELVLQPSSPYAAGGLVFGTGAEAVGIQQQIDQFLEHRIHQASSDSSRAETVEDIYKQLELQLQELGEDDLSTSLSTFLAAIQDVVNQPELPELKQLAIARGEELATGISGLRGRIDELRRAQSNGIDLLVTEANRLIDVVVSTNPQIAKLEASGLLQSDAGGLRAQRYDALNRLSEIIPVNYIERSDGSIDLFSGSNYLVLKGSYQHLESTAYVDRGVQVQSVTLSRTQSGVALTGGELGGIVEGRDTLLGGFVDQLDTWSAELIQQFNQLHSSGEGTSGFSSVMSEHTVLDPTVSLNDSATGLTFVPQHGSFDLKVTSTLTGLTSTTTIQVDLDGLGAPGSDTTLNSLRDAITAASSEVTASIDTQGRLQITAAANYEIRFSSDSSGVLAALGINTFFTGTDSSSIGVSDTVRNDPSLFATGQGGGPSDNRNIIALAGFLDNPSDGLGGSTLDDFYEQLITQVTVDSSTATTVANGFESFRQSLLNQRQQFSGVSLDEEAVKVLEFQRSFQSAARLISTIDELFDVLLSM
ncbi:MAG: flagellar hook-associated protein FlgK [Planctomycetaceae bacterium]|nr:flagellar hook-associated protein FlgK [Planctomycetaceae bacterium]